MKKITGKVVSLVLALALVVTSFSGTFAFASTTTKSVSGTVSVDNDTVYLVNGNAAKDSTGDITSFINPDVETKDHQSMAGDVKITAISHSSGDTLVRSTIDTDAGTADLQLKNTTSSGKEVLSVLYEDTYSNDDGDTVTVKARANFTINVLDAGSLVIGTGLESVNGKAVKTSTFAQNKNSFKTLHVYKAEPESTTNHAFAEYTPVNVTTAALASDSTAVGAKVSGTDAASIDATGDVNLVVGADHQTITATVGKNLVTGLYQNDGAVANVTITAKKVIPDVVAAPTKWSVSSSSDDKYTWKTKIEKKIDVTTLPGYSAGTTTTYVIQKTSGKTQLTGHGISAYTVTDFEVVFPTGTTSVSVDSGSVKKISGTVGALTIDAATVSGGVDVTATSIKVSDVKSKVGDITTETDDTTDITVSEGRVGNIDAVKNTQTGTLTTVTVNAGTTGTIVTKKDVILDATDEDNAITVAKVTAPTVTVFAENAKISVGGILTNANGTITVKGTDYATSLGTVDFDYRDTTLALGVTDDPFTGTISAPVNAAKGGITTEDEDTNVTVSGPVKLDTISVGSDSDLKFTDAITVDTIDGDGALTIAAGKLYVTGGISGTTLKVSDTIAVGTTVFKADSDIAEADDFTPYGFTMVKSTGTSVDTFKIATLDFAGVQINKSSSKIAKNYSETFTASAYPTGTSIPTGYTIRWDLTGSTDVFAVTTTGNTATVKVISIDPNFASENKATLTATLVDADGYDATDYASTDLALTAISVPEAVSDTNSALSVAKGASYQMKVTSSTVPSVTTGTNGVFSVVLASKNGNDYFYKLTATGAVGSATGIFLNGNKIFVAAVKAFAFTSDTTKEVTVKGAYQFKITSATTPTVSVGSAAFKLAFVSKTGNAYLYKITSAGAAGTKVGVYVNSTKAFVAAIG